MNAMNFRTVLPVEYSGIGIDHTKRGFIAGSCFAENISAKMSALKFSLNSNPSGILFNPSSIYEMCIALDARREFNADDLCNTGRLWLSYDHHGSFSGADSEEVVRRINSAVATGHDALRAADYVVFTFGTAWIYRLNSTGRVVANCHKQPSGGFTRHRLTVDEIVVPFSNLLQGMLGGKKVIFTVSPVRHLKDGFAENSLSKSILRTAVAELTDNFDNAWYFPSFEIMNDDLRDYRFYADDMVHPSAQAVEYIWQRFMEYGLTPEARALIPRLEKLRQAMNHRPLNPDAALLEPFYAKMQRHIEDLERDMPGVDFSQERAFFSRER